jgi:hypothetical protein
MPTRAVRSSPITTRYILIITAMPTSISLMPNMTSRKTMIISEPKVPSLLSTTTAEEKISHGRHLSTGAMMKRDGPSPPADCFVGQTVLISNISA